MGWSVWVLDQLRKEAHEVGGRKMAGLPEECLLTREAARAEWRSRLGRGWDRDADLAYAFAARAGFDVSVREGHELPDGYRFPEGYEFPSGHPLSGPKDPIAGLTTLLGADYEGVDDDQ